MRWKLLLVVSLLAAVVGAGASLGVIYGLLGSTRRLPPHDLAALSALLVPLVVITLASLFVYRHTARRRALQAAATAMLATFLTLTALVAGSLLLVPKPAAPEPSPTPAVKNAG